MTRLLVKADNMETLRELERFVAEEGGTVVLVSERSVCLSVEGLGEDAAARLPGLGATTVRPERQYHLDAPAGDGAP
jgi:hypothetical protein